MPEPLKNLFNPEMIALMGHHFDRAAPKFDKRAFFQYATLNIEALELKERSDQIVYAMEKCLPENFSDAAPVLINSLHPETAADLSTADMDSQGIRAWGTMPMTQFVGKHGLDDFDLGMDVQREITKRGSSEFGIRNFIIEDQDRALATLTNWAQDPNYHVRRLVSEGSRPRLPWAVQLKNLIENPEPLLPILERLRDDPVEYVRRSVANSLNDISKDHPDKVAAVAERWLVDAPPERKKLVRHACRTLIKRGHKATLLAFGYRPPNLSHASVRVLTPVVMLGSSLEIEFEASSASSKVQPLVIDYVIHHRKANGKTSPKVFKWKALSLDANADLIAKKKHSIKPITTRVYYEGRHRVEIVINGESFGSAEFELVL